MRKQSLNGFGKALLALGLLALCAVLACTGIAVKTLGDGYHALREADLSQRVHGSVSYDDRLYAVRGFAVEIDPADPEKEETLSSFLASSLSSIDRTILACGIFYTMLLAALLQYPLWCLGKGDGRRHVLLAAGSTAALFLLFSVTALLLHAAFRIPFTGPDARGTALLLLSLLAAAAGELALAALLRVFRLKRTAAILAVPLVFILFLFGFLYEHGLFCAPTEESFGYLAEIDPRVLDEDFTDIWYDSEKNVVILEGKEYAPEQYPNPEHYTGGARIGAFAYEILDPFGGNSLFWAEEDAHIPGWAMAVYLVKSLLWLGGAVAVIRKHGEEDGTVSGRS